MPEKGEASTTLPCKHVPTVMHDVIDQAPRLVHSPQVAWTTWSKMPVLFCAKCGASTTGTIAPNLKKRCLGKSTSELRQLHRGKVPGSRLRIGPVMPIHRA